MSNKGKFSARLTATCDLLLTQRIIFQPRLETTVAIQKDEEIGVGSGLNDLELGFRVRFEIRREFAPYLGLTWKESFGETLRLGLQEGRDVGHVSIAAGARVWF